jgi:hypothetical protein
MVAEAGRRTEHRSEMASKSVLACSNLHPWTAASSLTIFNAVYSFLYNYREIWGSGHLLSLHRSLNVSSPTAGK